MDLEKSWEKALRQTEIIRPRIQPLHTFDTTAVPYVLLSESLQSGCDTIVRKGQVSVERPALVLPSNHPQFEGFEMSGEKKREADLFMQFLLVRGIRFPSLKYNNLTFSLSLFDGRLQNAADHYRERLEKEENTSTGLVLGPEDCWQFSLLVFIASQVVRSAESDIERLLEQYRKKKQD